MFGNRRKYVTDKAQDAVDEFAAGAQEARRHIQAAGSGTADGLRRSARNTVRGSEDVIDVANGYMREHPVMTVGIAAAAAAMFAYLLFNRQ